MEARESDLAEGDDIRLAEVMVQLIQAVMQPDSADARAGIMALLREIDDIDPEARPRMAAAIQARRRMREGRKPH